MSQRRNESLPENTSNSFYASFKIYISKLGTASNSSASGSKAPSSKGGSSAKNQQANQAKNGHNTSKIVRIEQIESNDEEQQLENPQNVEVHIKVDPPNINTSENSTRENSTRENSTRENVTRVKTRENSPVFYLEPDDWCEEVVPRMVTSPTRAVQTNHCTSDGILKQSTSEILRRKMMRPQRSSSGSYLSLPSPRGLIISELAQQSQQSRQRKVTIPVLNSRNAMVSYTIQMPCVANNSFL